jgi:dual specificity MAP kinase phosphatase
VFPSSGCLNNPGPEEEQDLLDFCAWMYKQTHEPISSGISISSSPTIYGGVAQTTEHCTLQTSKTRRLLLTCKDGYTETSLLALCYLMYAEGISLDQAFLRLHKDKQRNFYCFTDDVTTLLALEPLLLNASPASRSQDLTKLDKMSLPWFQSSLGQQFSGNLPSRILDHLYLGNLEHSENLPMLKALGISRILSVGEHPAWQAQQQSLDLSVKPEAHLWVRQIQDDGIDPLARQIERCLEFIDEGVKLGQRTLVHCRVGVSRSASICIADVVRRLGLPLPEAYLMVRARRLNVIIQPNLRFMYELLDWTQHELSKHKTHHGEHGSRELVPRNMAWPALASRIAALNRHYISGSG